jgi:hypothetical protein
MHWPRLLATQQQKSAVRGLAATLLFILGNDRLGLSTSTSSRQRHRSR